MNVIAEIVDKTPSALFVLFIALATTAICSGLAFTNRLLAWSLFVITLLAGSLLSFAAASDAFDSGGMRDAIWNELGRAWVLAMVAGPLLPAIGVATALHLRRVR